jgi:hypothetical protein
MGCLSSRGATNGTGIHEAPELDVKAFPLRLCNLAAVEA